MPSGALATEFGISASVDWHLHRRAPGKAEEFTGLSGDTTATSITHLGGAAKCKEPGMVTQEPADLPCPSLPLLFPGCVCYHQCQSSLCGCEWYWFLHCFSVQGGPHSDQDAGMEWM